MNRRVLLLGALGLSACPSLSAASAPDWRADLADWVKKNGSGPTTLGTKLLPLDDPRWDEAHKILDSAPWGQTPIDVARYFIGDVPQTWIRAWRDSDFANPIVVLFFSATHDKPAGDTTAWCSAFLNWCLQRSEIPGTKSAGSQSFATWGRTVWTLGQELPGKAKTGDIALFKHKSDPAHGHVALFEKVSDQQAASIEVIGGNQIAGKNHIIQEKTMRIDVDLQLVRIATVKGLQRE